MEHSSAVACVQVAGTAVQKITYRDQQVITLPMVDRVHGRVDGTSRRTFNENRSRFTNGADYLTLDQANEIRSLGFSRPQGGTPAFVILLTRRGYLKIVKSLNDDRAWEVFDEMVSRYFATESAPSVPMLNDPSALRKLLLDNVEKVLTLESQVDEMRPAVEALEQIAEAHGSFCRTEAAKHLGVSPKILFRWLRTHGWTYHRPGSRDDLAYQTKINAGYLEHKVTTGPRPDGTEWISTQIRVTPKGLTVLAKALPSVGMLPLEVAR